MVGTFLIATKVLLTYLTVTLWATHME